MPDSSAATPLPDPNPGATPKPNLTVVPRPETSSPLRSELNRAQEAELTKSRDVCVAAQRAEYASVLKGRGVDAAFVTALLADITKAYGHGNAALNCTAAVKDAVRAEDATAKTLLGSLRTIQATARQQHLPDHPDKVDGYLVGENLDASRPVLEGASQAIIAKANTERPPGVDTDFIDQAQAERAAYVATNATQSNEQGKATQAREQRAALIKDIVGRRKKIQYAADAAWPPRKPESAQARVDFNLPASRPYSY